MSIHFIPLPTAQVTALRQSATDSYGLPVEIQHAPGTGMPCRHCLQEIPKGSPALTLAFRPFTGLNPYTETGPIFLCGADCTARAPSATLPGILTAPSHILRGYSADERIVYGTGGVVQTHDLPARAAALLSDPNIAFADIRSASNNCFLCRVIRAT